MAHHMTFFLLCWWCLWKHRHDVVFRNEQPSLQRLLRCCLDEANTCGLNVFGALIGLWFQLGKKFSPILCNSNICNSNGAVVLPVLCNLLFNETSDQLKIQVGNFSPPVFIQKENTIYLNFIYLETLSFPFLCLFYLCYYLMVVIFL